MHRHALKSRLLFDLARARRQSSPIGPTRVTLSSNLPLRTSSAGTIAKFSSSSSSSETPKETTTAQTTPPKSPTKHEFQAETSKLLNIVSQSLYSERDVFLRELISNASDALEKFRYSVVNLGENAVKHPGRELEIRITTDRVNKTLTVEDTGIGMTKGEMMNFLGTIGKSGSQAFVKNSGASATGGNGGEKSDATPATTEGGNKTIIGQFGVGFYSSFMVGEDVEVVSSSSLVKPPVEGKDAEDEIGRLGETTWRSQGTESYEVSSALIPEPNDDFNLSRKRYGTRITIKLKPDAAAEYSDSKRVKQIVKKYSSFISFPIFVDGEKINTVDAIWAESPEKVGKERYEEFFRLLSGSGSNQSPLYTLHYKADAPLDIKALLFVPKVNAERAGAARLKPGVNLYARRVILEANSPSVLPDWARFVRGAVDSEDLPLSISRETAQDKRVVERLAKAVTKRFIRHLKERATGDHAAEYNREFWPVFGQFIKEGVCTDFPNQLDLAKLVRFDTSLGKGGDDYASLDDVVARSPPEQKQLFYLSSPSRELALSSPYLDLFRRKGVEVIFVYTTLDDFVIANLRSYEGRDFVSAESSEVEELLKGMKDKEEAAAGGGEKQQQTTTEGNAATSSSGRLSHEEALELCEWVRTLLGDAVSAVAPTSRLSSSSAPGLVVDHESAALKRMMKMVNQADPSLTLPPPEKYRLELNPNSKIVARMLGLKREGNVALGKALARHVLDAALIQAGISDDPRDAVPRTNALLEMILTSSSSPSSSNATNGTETKTTTTTTTTTTT